MLYPAQLYKEELNKKLISCWYLPKYKHYFGGEYSVRQLENDAYWHRDFVHLNSKGEIDGYIGYNYNDINRSINGVTLIGFADNNTAFIKDVINHVQEMFDSGARRIEFYAFADNPAVKLYDKFIKRCGGRKVGTLTESTWYDGKFHDCYIYEIMNEKERNK